MAKLEKYTRWARGPLGMLTAAVVISLVIVATLQIINRHANATTLQANGRSFSLEVAATEPSRELGLGGRTSLPANHGMLFVFDQVKPECFWMKDMHFSIDMIWVSADKKVVHIEPNVSPSTYPNSFCPEAPVKYVIELNAGMAQAADIHDGETLVF